MSILSEKIKDTVLIVRECSLEKLIAFKCNFHIKVNWHTFPNNCILPCVSRIAVKC